MARGGWQMAQYGDLVTLLHITRGLLILLSPLVTPLPKPYPSFKSPPRPLAESVSGGADIDRFLELGLGLGGGVRARGRGGCVG